MINNRLRARVERLLDGQYRGDKPMQTLLLLLREHRRKICLAALVFAVKTSPMWVLPMATQRILDALIKPGPGAYHAMLVWGIAATICLAQNIPMHTLYANLTSAVMRDIQRDLRSALVVRLQQLSIAFHDDTHAGRLQTKVLRDVDNIGGVIKGGMDTALSGIVITGAAMTVAIRQAPYVAIFFLICVPVACFVMFRFREALRTRNQAFRRDMEGVSIRVNEMIEMLPVTRAHAAEGRETARMRRQLARITASGRRLDVTTERFSASGWVTFNAFQLLCLLFCATLVHKHQLTVGQLVMFQSYLAMIIGVVSATLGILPQLTAGTESIRSVGEILESPSIEEDRDKIAVDHVRGDLVFENISYAYPGTNRLAIEGFDLHIAAGECVALVGESGSGKSTLANLVIGFRRPTSGRILLDGVDTADLNFRTVRRHLAIVPQNTILFSGTIRENITYGLDDISDVDLYRALERANCTEFVGKLPRGVDSPIGAHGGKLSGGQRQRIAVARALLRDPSMLILDEATSALDAHSEHLVQQAIEELITGRTTIIIAHRLATLRSADRIVVLRNGAIVEQGSWDELLSRKDSAFARFHALQNETASLQAA